MTIISADDLPAVVQDNELVGLYVDGANARAARVAPCLVDTETEPTTYQLDEARLILVGAVKRWAEAGAGALQSQTAGPFGMQVDTRQRTGFNFWPSEIEALQEICRDATATGGAFTIDTTSPNVEEFDEELWWTSGDTWAIG